MKELKNVQRHVEECSLVLLYTEEDQSPLVI
jgi:hypothetical protein